jgi:DNA polymerase III delta prime subunit
MRADRFNPIASTLMRKALNDLVGRGGWPKLQSKTLDIIISAANGDIRSAVYTLQFIMRDPEQISNLQQKSERKSNKKKDSGTSKDVPASCVPLFHLITR